MGKRESQIVAMAEELLKCSEFKPGLNSFQRNISAHVWATRMWEAANG